MTLRALIFDVDGTLADTERDGHRCAFNAAFAEAGLDWHWGEEQYGALLEVTGGKERISHFATSHSQNFFGAGDINERIRNLHAAKTRHYLNLLGRGEIPLRAGVPELLRSAHASGLRLAIATTTTPENVAALLPADLMALFEIVGAGDTVETKKPAPDIYLWVLGQLDLPASGCLAIEDSAPGLAAARTAGIATLVTPCDYTVGQTFDGAVAVLPDLRSITLAMLRNWHAEHQKMLYG